MSQFFSVPIISPESITLLKDKKDATMMVMLDCVFNPRVEARTKRESELVFGLSALASYLSNTGKIQSLGDSLVRNFPWISQAAHDIHSKVVEIVGPQLIPYLERSSSYFGDGSVQADLNRDVNRRITPAGAYDLVEFCEGVAVGKITLELSDLKSQ